MSLKYRLIILTIAVFAGTFGIGTPLGVQGARHLAESQLRARLARAAGALAASGAPLNDEALALIAPVLDAEVMVLDSAGRMRSHSRGGLPWEELGRSVAAATRSSGRSLPEAAGRRYYCAQAEGRLSATGEHVTVYVLTDQAAIEGPTRSILVRYLTILCVTAAMLSVGMYLVGWRLVRRVKRACRRIDATLSEGPVARPGGGDELRRLEDAFDDLLERLQVSRQRLAAQQRLATAGKLASSVAHEVRNPLQAIRLTVQMLREKSPPDAREGFDLVLGEIDRLNLLTDELLILAGKDVRRVEAVDLARELHEMLRLMQFQLRQRDLRTEVDVPSLPAAIMDRNRCRQLLLNLLLNAAEASPRGGGIHLHARAEAGAVILRIADSGPGFPQEVLTGQAEEFFSTKVTGAGLGLSICRRIVTEAGGRLNLYNADGGAVAEVSLPTTDRGTVRPGHCERAGGHPDCGR